MRLARPFYRLPLQFDAERLRSEVEALPVEAWAPHPNSIPGNSSVRLISAEGGENDAVNGRMLPTRWLAPMPYTRQVLHGLGVVWSRSRLMRLAPGAEVPEHADINRHWFSRVRLHIPIITRPEVRFSCGDEAVHMAAGSAWLFDNWRRHRVVNPTPDERIHLVADTSGTAEFWQLAETPDAVTAQVHFQPGLEEWPLTETNLSPAVLHPDELKLLLDDLLAELVCADDSPATKVRLQHMQQLLKGLTRDWRQLCALHGIEGRGAEEFGQLADAVRTAARPLAAGLVMKTNGVEALRVLEARVLQHLVNPATVGPARISTGGAVPAPLLERPVFIVAAPRSGSTLLFETLACSNAFNTFGGEAHWLIEGIEALRPGAPDVESNRLEGRHATPDVIAAIRIAAQRALQGPDGAMPRTDACLLEKTPKNSLRIPFLDRVFPDARFIFLWRDPRENISSIIEAWRAGRWITYESLPGRIGSWSLLLPPQWQALHDKPLEAIAATQWNSANATALSDLLTLAPERWTAVSHAALIADPAGTVSDLCDFLGIDFDATLRSRTAQPLPASRYTLTPPRAEKWRDNAVAIARVLPAVADTWQKLQALGQTPKR